MQAWAFVRGHGKHSPIMIEPWCLRLLGDLTPCAPFGPKEIRLLDMCMETSRWCRGSVHAMSPSHSPPVPGADSMNGNRLLMIGKRLFVLGIVVAFLATLHGSLSCSGTSIGSSLGPGGELSGDAGGDPAGDFTPPDTRASPRRSCHPRPIEISG